MVPSSADIIYSHRIGQSETIARTDVDVVDTYPLQKVRCEDDQNVNSLVF